MVLGSFLQHTQWQGRVGSAFMVAREAAWRFEVSFATGAVSRVRRLVVFVAVPLITTSKKKTAHSKQTPPLKIYNL
eukprot:11214648-Lingulodinium_polyedra.AAC.1